MAVNTVCVCVSCTFIVQSLLPKYKWFYYWMYNSSCKDSIIVWIRFRTLSQPHIIVTLIIHTLLLTAGLLYGMSAINFSQPCCYPTPSTGWHEIILHCNTRTNVWLAHCYHTVLPWPKSSIQPLNLNISHVVNPWPHRKVTGVWNYSVLR